MSAQKAGACPQPPSWDSRRLWSLWEMIRFQARPVLNLVLGFAELERHLARASTRERFDKEVLSELSANFDSIAEELDSLRLDVAAEAARGLRNVNSWSEAEQTIQFVRNALMIGLNKREFLEPDHQYAKYFEQTELFGKEVFQAFPSATDDITEAGNCLALERSTACVMHLMRATEAALKALAKSCNVQPQGDWGSYIREIYKELEKQAKAAGAKTQEHQFLGEAAAQIDNVKRAWRNPSMHVDKSYSQPRAEEILLATKSLMSHLATKISE
jgi:hypothetical protein